MTNRANITATYRFTRDSASPVGFSSRNRPSTDAKSVVDSWKLRGEGRSVEVLEDGEEVLVAKLTLRPAEIEKARSDMDSLCLQFGVSRDAI